MTENGIGQPSDAGAQVPLVPAEFPRTRQGLEQLRAKLNAAYESATRMGAEAAADKADAGLDEVESMLLELDREAAAARDGAMQAAATEVKAPLARLEILKGEIASIDRDVAIFGDVLQGIDTAIGLWKSCFSV